MRTPCPSCNGHGRTLADPCTKCHGKGKVEQKRTVSVNVPAGIDEGARIRLQGEGDVGDSGAPNGDLLVYIYVTSHEFFTRRGLDLHCELAIKFHRAALGGTIKVPTLWGEAKLKIPAGIQPGQTLRMKGMGMPHHQIPDHKGAQYVTISVEVPKKLSSRHKEILKEMAELEGDEIQPRKDGILDRLKDMLSGGE